MEDEDEEVDIAERVCTPLPLLPLLLLSLPLLPGAPAPAVAAESGRDDDDEVGM